MKSISINHIYYNIECYISYIMVGESNQVADKAAARSLLLFRAYKKQQKAVSFARSRYKSKRLSTLHPSHSISPPQDKGSFNKRVNNVNTRMDLSKPAFPVELPPYHFGYKKADSHKLTRYLQSGIMSKPTWTLVTTNLASSLQILLGRSVEVERLHVKHAFRYRQKYHSNKQKTLKRSLEEAGLDPKVNNKSQSKQPSSTPSDLPEPIDIDQLMKEKKLDAFYLHDDTQVFLCVFSSEVCEFIYTITMKLHNVSLNLDSLILEGIKKVGNEDQMQKEEEAVYTANYGCTDTNMTSYTGNCTSTQSVSIDNAIGCHRGGSITTQAGKFAASPQSFATPKCESFCFPVFKDDRLPKADRWFGPRDNGKKQRIPRYSSTQSFLNQDKLKLPFSLVSSVPRLVDPALIAACQFENRVRTMAECLLVRCFSPLPFANLPLLAAENVSRACTHGRQTLKLTLPCQGASRLFPKGATGMMRTKSLHDDGNGALCPGIWTSVVGDPAVVLRFKTTQFNVHFKCTNYRFAWFMGWIPHMTEVAGDLNARSAGPMKNMDRIHHSAFWKPKMEHIALVEFHEKCYKAAVNSYSHKVETVGLSAAITKEDDTSNQESD